MTNIPPVQPPMNAPQPFIMPDAQPTKNGNGMAKASFILGLCSLIPLLGLLTGMLALIFGIIALTTKTTKTWMAVTGLVLAVAFPVVGSVMVMIMKPSLGYAKESARQAGCRANMSSLGKGVIMYMTVGDVYPPDFDALIKDGYATEDGQSCPSSGHAKGVRDYLYVCPSNEKNPDLPSTMVIACDIGKWHADGGRAVLHADGTVMFCRTDAQFQMILARPENAKFAAALRQAESGGR